MEYPPVNLKTDFTRRYAEGEFGNKTRVWPSLNAYLVDSYFGMVHLRNRVPGGHTWYKCSRDHRAEGLRPILDAYQEALELGYKPNQLYVGQMIPKEVEESLLVQGELWESPELYLYYSYVPIPMRDSLRLGGQHATGTAAHMILRRCLCPNSLEWMRELLERYPGHVVEFSSYGVNFGSIPGYNTIFWEVRNY